MLSRTRIVEPPAARSSSSAVGTYKVLNEIKTKRNQRNETKPTKVKRNQLKQNEILHKFAFSQIIQDGLEFQIPDTICLLDFPDLLRLIPPKLSI